MRKKKKEKKKKKMMRKLKKEKSPWKPVGCENHPPRSAEADDSLSPQDRERGENRVGNFYIQHVIEKDLAPWTKAPGRVWISP